MALDASPGAAAAAVKLSRPRCTRGIFNGIYRVQSSQGQNCLLCTQSFGSIKQMAQEVVELLKWQENKPLFTAVSAAFCLFFLPPPFPLPTTFNGVQVQEI